METLNCSTCHTERPTSDFAIDKTKKRGYSYKCKPCHKEYLKANKHPPTTQPLVCASCHLVLPAENFYVAPYNPTGRNKRCSSCVIEKRPPMPLNG